MYLLPKLAGVKGVFHAFSEKGDGNMSFKHSVSRETIENRERFIKSIGTVEFQSTVAMRPFYAEVGKEIVQINHSHAGMGMYEREGAIPAEAFVTNIPRLPLFLTVADCSPIIIFDPRTMALALFHASRIMTGKRMIERVIRGLQDCFHADPRDFIVGIGPGIKQGSYRLEYIEDTFLIKDFDAFIKKGQGSTVLLDIPGINRELLVQNGVLAENIEMSPIDTAQSNQFFSHYRAYKNSSQEGFFAVITMIL